ncbi:MAG: glycerol-3-phosphate 1-O-acyltransferase PlsY [Vicinamibacterales bacterium]
MSLIVVSAYLIGSVPFALILARRWGADLRQVGSGNLGAANVLRSSGVKAGVLVALLDMSKGAVSVVLAQRLSQGAADASAAAGIAAIVGHIYPVWLGFRGGKGVAAACGVFAMLTPVAVVPALATFTAGIWFTRYISVGSVLASIVLPPVAYALGSPLSAVVAAIFASALIVFRHRSNLQRVRQGTERRIGLRL